MRSSQTPISPLKEVPADAEVISHRLMLRTGMIRRLAAGLYVLLPFGLRTPRQGERLGRGEMGCAGAVHADPPARGAMEGIGPLDEVWSGIAALQGSPRARVRLRAHPRGSH